MANKIIELLTQEHASELMAHDRRETEMLTCLVASLPLSALLSAWFC